MSPNYAIHCPVYRRPDGTSYKVEYRKVHGHRYWLNVKTGAVCHMTVDPDGYWLMVEVGCLSPK